VPLYRELIEITRKTLAYLRGAAARLTGTSNPAVALWQAKVRHHTPLIERVIAQSERRVLCGEAVPASEKLVSLFETHADIIVKGSRDVQYGHKLNLTTGRSGLILDLVIEAGNPADSDRLLPMLERHIAWSGGAPRQATADGGFASRDNLSQAKACGVRDMAFHKKSGLSIEDMVRSRWVYRKLRNFRAGIEAGISCLKRAYGLARCTWRGLDHFKAYVWSSVVAYNLIVFVRLRSA
jgi:transposase, IS5 family